MNVGDTLRKRVAEIDAEIPKKQKEIDVIAEKIKALRAERRNLAVVVRRLDGMTKQGPAVSDEQVLSTVRTLGIATAKDVADQLEVTPRNVARKLRKLVDDGQLVGTPEDGYRARMAA